jgi:hypothetical protein
MSGKPVALISKTEVSQAKKTLCNRGKGGWDCELTSGNMAL